MALLMTEEEQLEALKRWWKDNGVKTLAVVAVIGFGYLGFSQYQKHQQVQAQAASRLFDSFIAEADKAGLAEGVADVDAAAKAELASLAEALGGEYDKTLYARFAELYEAKLAVAAGDLERARAALEKARAAAGSEALQNLVTMRLARVEIAAGAYDKALALLNEPATPAYADAFAELRGDIYLLQQDYTQARTAYQTALAAMTDPRSMRRSLVQLKLDNATVATDQAEPSPAEPAAATEAAEGV